MAKKIMFTGGGSAGHVSVNLALIPRFQAEGWTVEYIGSHTGIEKQLVANVPGVKYFGIATGKLRRYLDWNNVKDPFRVVKGVFQASRTIKRSKPDVIFSKGGFVSVPVVLGAKLNRVPVIIHESDITPGLANRIAIPFATKVCTTFSDTDRHLPAGKAHYVGPIIREALNRGSLAHGRAWTGFTNDKPVLLVMGGSLGSRKINLAVREALPSLLERYQVLHLCGKSQTDDTVRAPGYMQVEYIQDELPDVLTMTDLVVSRAGANSIFEFLHLRKPMLLIPLTKAQSRGDQILNAESFRKAGYSDVLPEENLTAKELVSRIDRLYDNRQTYIKQMEAGAPHTDALANVIDLIKRVAKEH
ncbi:UDP-N-acetylglucosamine-N-acetylmuramylpentapeptide N-acetylglucosamine transferase [Cohnella sp. OV330]|uniref:undecaprenyldiphospho-muramoylpentapeptide beta-N-acetylglucosaminyltransferase n=1 Tax=Cohnella sp. OV330 TaxID=1855288 RepID=UPI0008E6A0C8|nr:undecaprenyldiphospho-muramoylpentapeptide beta-N-acetylglucosaminyltransferase [Cohnella sp. OV330]SFB59885.1 UDP-N-acetylglucosamine-N-acetylmuramylpentapeptide N-acetylglucosamine transferase [Cohnella sp. OV330]